MHKPNCKSLDTGFHASCSCGAYNKELGTRDVVIIFTISSVGKRNYLQNEVMGALRTHLNFLENENISVPKIGSQMINSKTLCTIAWKADDAIEQEKKI